jgi:PII-like signaling protein
MRTLDGQMCLMRIFIGENDQHAGKPLHEALVETLRREGIAGATVLRGVLGYGASSVLHDGKSPKHVSDLPLCVEVVDSDDHISRILPKLDNMVTQGLITMEKVRVIRYAPF